MKEIISYCYMTGSRRNEIANQTWENIDIGKRTITIRNSDTFQTKSKKNRIIPLNRALDEMLRGKYLQEQILDRKNFVFKFNGKQVSSDYVTRNFARTARGLGYGPEITFHSLRHSFITNLITSGTDINTVKELAGHSSITTTSQYIHTTNEIKRRAVEML
ncbi:MAG: site-specific integrase [Ignavibacteriae bacterium]|nr:site-specific integrase [Ignavibacteriota bacterium]